MTDGVKTRKKHQERNTGVTQKTLQTTYSINSVELINIKRSSKQFKKFKEKNGCVFFAFDCHP